MKKDERNSSLEEIHCALSLHGGVVVSDDRYVQLIVRTLHQIPKRTRNTILAKVHFMMVGEDTHGYPVEYSIRPSTKEIKMRFIVLNFCAMKKEKDSEIMTTIAHEIAHCVLGDYNGALQHTQRSEQKADDLAEKWGFGRAYKDYQAFSMNGKPIRAKAGKRKRPTSPR